MTELVVALRWAALCLAVVAIQLRGVTRASISMAAVLAIVAVVRTVWPVRLDLSSPASRAQQWPARAALATEFGLCLLAVAVTGTVDSPFLISLGAAAFIIGLIVPPWAFGLGAVAAIVVAAAAGIEATIPREVATRAVERLAILGGGSLLGSYSQWLLRTGRASHGDEVERLRNLTEVNHLLLELHAKAASVPASLNLKEAVATAVSRLRGLLDPDVVVLLLSDPTTDDADKCWQVLLAEGVRLPELLASDELPPALAEAMNSLGPVCRSNVERGEGVALETSSGLYVPLWARDCLIGLLAVERVNGAKPFANADLEIVEGVARHAGLAIDNARWFRRLRTLGAEEERGRIARELHDRVGQSLAYVAMSLDRLGQEIGVQEDRLRHQDVVDELGQLASEVRRATGDIRTKLSDLRVEVAQGGEISEALGGLLTRVEQRSGIGTFFFTRGNGSLSPVVEREVARIAQEAINNAERHAGAGHIGVRWDCDPSGAELEVADDGRGLAATAPLRRDAFGILGMRERAEAIGASLAINSAPGQGTTVTLRVGARRDYVPEVKQ